VWPVAPDTHSNTRPRAPSAPTRPDDPLRTLWDALEDGGYGPHGQPHDFRSRCPVHDGGNATSLHVCAGGNGSVGCVVAYCHAHRCDGPMVARALGLPASALYPPGHRKAHRRSLPAAQRDQMRPNARAVRDTLSALDALGLPWQASLTTVCPYCGAQGAWLRTSHDGDVVVDCESGCRERQFTGALAGRLSTRFTSALAAVARKRPAAQT
jgi:hypothetical protein